MQPFASNQSSGDREIGEEEEDIYELYEKSQTELKLKTKELIDTKTMLKLSTSRLPSSSNDSSNNVLELKDKLRFLEKQLVHAREQNDKWGQSYDALTMKLGETEAELNDQRTINNDLEIHIKQLQEALQGIDQEKNEIIGRSLTEIRNHDEGLLAAQRALNNKNHLLTEAHGKITDLKRQVEEYRSKVEELKNEVTTNQAEGKETRRMLSAALDELKIQRSVKLTEQSSKVEIQHLKLDNARMVRLLAATDEYQNWLRMAQFSHGVTYVPQESKDRYDHSSREIPRKSKSNSKKVGSSRLADFGVVETFKREYPSFDTDGLPVGELTDFFF
jgi:hypothetical protein